MRIIVFLLFSLMMLFSLSSTAQEIKLNCKGFHTSKDLMIDDGIREIEYEETLHLNLEDKALFWLSIKQFYVFETGIKKEAHTPVVYEKLSPSNLVMLYDESENNISFGNAYVDGKLYSMEQFLPMKSLANNIRVYNYFVKKDSLKNPNEVKINKLITIGGLQSETAALPEINFTCEKINY